MRIGHVKTRKVGDKDGMQGWTQRWKKKVIKQQQAEKEKEG